MPVRMNNLINLALNGMESPKTEQVLLVIVATVFKKIKMKLKIII
jgi:hypothetical protein